MDEQEKPKAKRRTRSAAEKEEIVEFVAFVLGSGAPKTKVKELLRARFLKDYKDGAPPLSARGVERYIAAAKLLIVKWSGKSKQEHFEEACGFYVAMIQASYTTPREKMEARARLDALLGHEPAKTVKVAGDKDAPLAVAVSVEQVVAARAKVEAWRQQRFGSGGDGPPMPSVN